MALFWRISLSARDVFNPTRDIVVMASLRRELYNVTLNIMSQGGEINVPVAVRVKLARIVSKLWRRWVRRQDPPSAPRQALPWPTDDKAIFIQPSTRAEYLRQWTRSEAE